MNAQPENLIKQIDLLLSHTRSVISHQKERERLLGEKFNVFSILRMERSENSTHSAFISELLKPDGSHLKGDLFLRLFLKVLGNDTLELESAKVITEYYIGRVDAKGKTGGRIDIFIFDKTCAERDTRSLCVTLCGNKSRIGNTAHHICLNRELIIKKFTGFESCIMYADTVDYAVRSCDIYIFKKAERCFIGQKL